jgi:hypothetical protein
MGAVRVTEDGINSEVRPSPTAALHNALGQWPVQAPDLALFNSMPAHLARGARMTKLDERVATLEEKLKQLKVRQQRAVARASALASSRARKDDTRRKILAGALVLAKVEAGEIDSRTFKRWLDKALIRSDDRKLFGL